MRQDLCMFISVISKSSGAKPGGAGASPTSVPEVVLPCQYQYDKQVVTKRTKGTVPGLVKAAAAKDAEAERNKKQEYGALEAAIVEGHGMPGNGRSGITSEVSPKAGSP
ncbi:hypothetical protein EDB80DRAFT_686041 [Ilyonectria destructans]|nr:hypothetical protein EDB80DRAFT_686041 [Ilyonectria destructans]